MRPGVAVFSRQSLLLTLALAIPLPAVGDSNIREKEKFCWGENIGWINWRDAGDDAEGVIVAQTFLSGFAWGENVGWINFGLGKPAEGPRYRNETGEDFGVNIDDNCNLFGFAWGENIGWINFDTRSQGRERARMDCATRRFRGYVWGENVGWINLDDSDWFVGFDAFPPCCGPDCPAAGVVTCDDIQVAGPPGNAPGDYVIRVSATVPAGEQPLYVFRVVNAETGETATSDPGSAPEGRVSLPAGTWIFSASVGTDRACPFVDCSPVEVVVECVEDPDSVEIVGPDAANAGTVVELMAVFSGADDGGLVTYDWEVIGGAGQIVGAADASSVQVMSAVGGEVTVRVGSGDGVCEDDAEATHTVSFRDCPAPGGVSCDGVQVSGPPGDAPGDYVVRVTATVPAGEQALYFYRVENVETGESATAGPGPARQVDISLPAGIWDVSVAIGTRVDCPFVPCDVVRVVVTEEQPASVGPFVRGDCNADRTLNTADAVCILEWLYADGTVPGCIAVTNVNGDDAIDTSDALYALLFLTAGGTEPVAPFPTCDVSTAPADQLMGYQTIPDYCR